MLGKFVEGRRPHIVLLRFSLHGRIGMHLPHLSPNWKECKEDTFQWDHRQRDRRRPLRRLDNQPKTQQEIPPSTTTINRKQSWHQPSTNHKHSKRPTKNTARDTNIPDNNNQPSTAAFCQRDRIFLRINDANQNHCKRHQPFRSIADDNNQPLPDNNN